MNRLHKRLQSIAFELLQGDELDREAAAWIQKWIKHERTRPRKKRKRKVRLKDGSKATEFWINHEKLRESPTPGVEEG